MFPYLQQTPFFQYETDNILRKYSNLASYKNLLRYRKLNLDIILRILDL